MPLVYHEWINDNLQLGLWHITESVDDLISKLFLNKEEFETLNSFGSDSRRKQWLSYRALIRNLVESDYIYRIYYDDNKKPFLVNPQRSISITHCNTHSAVLISPSMTLAHGLDIEPVHPKILKITDKFMNPTEAAEWSKSGDTEKAVAYWSFKESIFKAYGKRYVSLKGNIVIEPFLLTDNEMRGLVKLKSKQRTYKLKLRSFDNLTITIAQEDRDLGQ
jgi:phosphopantetheinyl transferase